MPSDVTVKIRVPQYLKKYIAAQSLNKSEPLVFHHKHVNAISLVQKVSNFNTLKQIPLSERENVREHFSPHIPRSGNIIIQLPWSRDKDVRRLNYLSQRNKKRFRQEVKDDFYFELVRHLIRRMRQNVQHKDAIMEFLKKYDITEDDLKFESIYRQSSRILEPFL